MPTTYFWKGETSSDIDDGDNWFNPLTSSVGTRPTNGDSVVFDSTSDSHNDCQFTSATFPTSGDIVDITISANFTKFLTTNTNTTLNIDGKLEINVGGKIKPTHSMTFDFNTAGTTTVYDGNGDSYTHKPLVIYNVADSMFNSESARANTTFNFGALNLSMIDGIYPNITFTGTIYTKSIYSNNSRSLHNTYGSVDILDFNGGSIDSTLYNIYDYDKQFLFEKGFTSIGQFFRFGHTTARFKTYRSSGTGSVIFPATGELNSAAFGDDTNNNFYTQYNKIIIENNDSASNYWLLRETIECNELIINDGGRFYGPSDGSRAAAIRCVKRPTLKGDWNYRQITDGIYESIGDSSNVSVYHGGTGRQTLTKNALLYGNGMDSVNLLGIGTAGKYLKVNSGATGYEWDTVSGGSSGTVTSVGLSETGTALTITNSPITTSGTINIAGAGTSSQVILGDLTLGTLTSGTVTPSSTDTFTNKTLDADATGNSITNIDTGNFTSAFQSTYANNSLHPIFFERGAINTRAVDFRAPTTTTSSANPNAFPMPYAGKVISASFIFSGGTITNNSSATNTIRIRKNGGSSGSDIFDTDVVTQDD